MTSRAARSLAITIGPRVPIGPPGHVIRSTTVTCCTDSAVQSSYFRVGTSLSASLNYIRILIVCRLVRNGALTAAITPPDKLRVMSHLGSDYSFTLYWEVSAKY